MESAASHAGSSMRPSRRMLPLLGIARRAGRTAAVAGAGVLCAPAGTRAHTSPMESAPMTRTRDTLLMKWRTEKKDFTRIRQADGGVEQDAYNRGFCVVRGKSPTLHARAPDREKRDAVLCTSTKGDGAHQPPGHADVTKLDSNSGHDGQSGGPDSL